MYYCSKIVGDNGLFSYSLGKQTFWKYQVKVAQLCPTLCDPMDYTVHGFSRPEYWSGWPFASPGDLPNPGIQPRSPALQGDSLSAEPQVTPESTKVIHKK